MSGRIWLVMLLLMLFTWLVSEQTAAQTYIDKSYNYSVMLGGSNTMNDYNRDAKINVGDIDNPE